MDLTASLPLRLQFAFTVFSHIIFPAFLFRSAGIVVLPITLACAGIVYFVFRGKILPSS